MDKFKSWLIDRLLKEGDLVAVTKDWQVEYVKLASYKAQHKEAMAELAKEYNLLLEDYFNLMTAKNLCAYLKSMGANDAKISMGKEKLVELAMSTFKMSFSRE